MAIRKASATVATIAAPLTELAVTSAVSAIPQPSIIAAPDVMVLFQEYNKQVSPWSGFQVVDDATYIKAGQGFQEVADYIDSVEGRFKQTVATLHRAWQGMTGLRGMFANPAEVIKQNLATQQMSHRQRKEAERRAEEQRLQREAEEQARRDQEILRQQLEAEQQAKYEAEKATALEAQASKMPWEEDDISVPEEPEPIVMPPVEVAEVRLPSTVPVLVGVQPRKLPFACKVTDFKAMVIWIGKQCAEGDDRWLSLLEPDMPKLNALAKEHTTLLAQLIPGTEGFQGETQARR